MIKEEISRLTTRNCANYDDFAFSFRNSLITRSELDNGIYKKLKQLEDLQDELGVDLITFFDNYRELKSMKGRNLRLSIEEIEKELGKKLKN